MCVHGSGTTRKLLLWQLHTSQVSHCNLTLSNIHTIQGHRSAKVISQMTKVTVYDDCAELMCEHSVAVFGDNSDTDFRYHLMRKAVIFARFSAEGLGLAYTWDS